MCLEEHRLYNNGEFLSFYPRVEDWNSTADKERNLVLLLLDFYFYGNRDVTGACNA